MRTVTGRTLAVVVGTLLLGLGSTGRASATYEPGEPDLTWNQQSHARLFEFMTGVSTYGDTVWSVGYGAPVNDGTRTAVVIRRDTEGRLLSRLDESGGADYGQDYAWDVEAGAWGAVVVGRTDGAFPGTGRTADPYTTDTWVQRFAPDGTVMWAVQYPTNSIYFTKAITVVGDTLYVVGDTRGDFSVDALSLQTGQTLRSRSFGTGAYDTLRAVTSVDGMLVAAGSTEGEFVTGSRHGDSDNVVMALDSDTLDLVWADQFGTTGLDFVSAVESRDHQIYWAGTLGNRDDYDSYLPLVGGVGSMTATGASIWQQRLGPGYAVVRALTTTSQGLVISGHVSKGALGAEEASYGDDDAFLQGRSFSGDTLWTEVYGGTSYDTFDSLDSVGDDRLYAAGATYEGMLGETHEHGAGVVAQLDVPHLLRPDLSLQVRPGRAYRGDNTYATAAKPIRLTLHRGGSLTTRVRLEDDGFLRDRLTLASCRGLTSHVHLSVHRGRRDVTSSARAGAYRTPRLAAGSGQTLTLRLRADALARGAHTCTLTTRSSSSHASADRIRLRIVVKP